MRITKVTAKFSFLAVIAVGFLSCPNLSGQTDQWQLRAEFFGEIGAGLGRKLTIEGDKVFVGSISGLNIVNPVRGPQQSAMIELMIEDPIPSEGNCNGNPVTNRCGFGYSLAAEQTGENSFRLMIGDTGHSLDENGQEAPNMFGAQVGDAHLYDLDLNQAVILEDFSNPVPFLEQDLFGSPLNIGSEFGHDVVLEGGFAAVGAPFDTVEGFMFSALGTGKAFAFDLNSGSPTSAIELYDATPGTGDGFGAYLAISNGIIAVSDQGDDVGLASGEGKVRLYDASAISGDTLLPFEVITADSATTRQFGWDVDMHDDLILVGHTHGASLYQLVGQDANLIFTITDPMTNGQPVYGTFGRHVSLDENRIVVARQGQTNLVGDAIIPEAVFVFTYNVASATYEQETVLFDEAPGSALESYPSAVDISGNLLAVGSNFAQNTMGYRGEFFLYDFGRLIGDVNRDGAINLIDVGPFVDALSGSYFQFEADINEDGAVNALDISPFVDLLNNL